MCATKWCGNLGRHDIASCEILKNWRQLISRGRQIQQNLGKSANTSKQNLGNLSVVVDKLARIVRQICVDTNGAVCNLDAI